MNEEPDFNKFLAECRREETADFWKAARFMTVLITLALAVGYFLILE